MKLKSHATLLIVFFAVLYLFLHYPFINQWPLHVHAWTQTDRLALAKGFVDNGLDFFYPQTYLLKEHIPDTAIQERSRITPVDFPLHDYMPAVIMKITGSENQAIFRIYIFIYGLLGLIFLFRLSKLITNSYFKAWIVMIFAATSPIFVFYHSGFLPTIPSLANAFIGLYFYAVSVKRQKERFYWIAILFLTLAALCRTTFVIPLIAVFGGEFLRFIQQKKSSVQYFLPVFLSFAVLLLYRWHNANLQDKYGTIFLSRLLPPESFEQAIEWIKITIQNWGLRYFSWVHYVVFILVVFAWIIKYKSGKTDNLLYGNFWVLTGFLFLGSTMFFIAMMQQFPAHDYYFLDTFFLPITLLFILIIQKTPMPGLKKSPWLQCMFILVFLVSSFLISRYVQHERRNYGTWNRSYATYQNFQGSDRFLDSLGVDQHATMMVVDAYVPNVPMMLMDRKGYALMTSTKDYIQRALRLQYDYLVFQKPFFVSDVYTGFPEIINHLHKIGDNEKIMVCTWSPNPEEKSLMVFLGLENKQPLFNASMSFDSAQHSPWQKTEYVTNPDDANDNVGYLDKNTTYGLTFKTRDYSEFFQLPRLVLVSLDAQIQIPAEVHIALSMVAGSENLHFETRNLNKLIREKDQWKHLELLFQIPSLNHGDIEFGLFFWNTGGAKVLYDNVSFKVF